jgi:pyridinium-3,5-biscarboxylic acid mononucleotide synthase
MEAESPYSNTEGVGIAMSPKELEQLATRLLAGKLTIDEFVSKAGHSLHASSSNAGVAGAAAGESAPQMADVGHAKVDLDRRRRCGFSEVVFAEGKSVEALEQIFKALVRHHADVLATRMSAEQYAQLRNNFPNGQYNPIARTFRIPHASKPNTASPQKDDSQKTASEPNCPTTETVGHVVIVTAGTTDLPVAEEARETVAWTGAHVTMIQDVGVAGPHRLTANLPLLENADAIVVVAGMEGALPSVVGGHVSCPVIAVPTSVGYGASFGGIAALLGMLNSCASNVTVVNIDAGFKGGYVAGLIAKNIAKARAAGR